MAIQTLFRSVLQKSDVPLTAEAIDDIFEPVFGPEVVTNTQLKRR